MQTKATILQDLPQFAQEWSAAQLSIANGNYIGSGPEVCLDMTDAFRRCVRPTQQFGRLCSYETKDIPHGGTTLTGHSYSTRLHTPFLSTFLPVKPCQGPCRVLCASGFVSKKAIVRRAELAMVLLHPDLPPCLAHGHGVRKIPLRA